ncbi:MAG: aminodeoxychorismate synthase component I [Campylobacter sp.]|nr:aminodeoxychorismate synthase component I [Campylobacter sp.]
MASSSVFAKMDEWSKTSTPFVAIIGYDDDLGVACELKDTDKFGIKFRINLCDDEIFGLNLRVNSDDKIYNKCSKFASKLQISKLPPTYFLKTFPPSFDEYQKAFDRVIKYIKKGDAYLLNLCFETKLNLSLSLDEIFEYSNANLVLKYKDEFVCFSPEVFVIIDGGKISAYPMKGTIDASIKDAKNALLNNPKEFSEQAMMTDLMRNDLSIVGDDTRVEKFRYFSKIRTKNSQIYQTSSKITSQLKLEFMGNLGQIFKALLPAGSITGTPKPRVAQIIKECETSPRGFFSGVFVYFDGKVCVSFVLIRFVGVCAGKMHFKSGGGLTAESDLKKEYDELRQKVYFTF